MDAHTNKGGDGGLDGLTESSGGSAEEFTKGRSALGGVHFGCVVHGGAWDIPNEAVEQHREGVRYDDVIAKEYQYVYFYIIINIII